MDKFNLVYGCRFCNVIGSLLGCNRSAHDMKCIYQQHNIHSISYFKGTYRCFTSSTILSNRLFHLNGCLSGGIFGTSRNGIITSRHVELSDEEIKKIIATSRFSKDACPIDSLPEDIDDDDVESLISVFEKTLA